MSTWILLALAACDPGGGAADDAEGVAIDCTFGVIDEDQTWSGEVDVGCSLNVLAEVRVEPGTVARMAEGITLSFGEGGSLQALGTEQEPITLEAQAGSWNTLAFMHPSAPSTMEWTTISGGGAPDLVFGEAMVVVGDASFAEGDVAIRDCVFDGSATAGLDLRYGAASVERTTFVGMGGPAVVTTVELAPALSEDVVFSDEDATVALTSPAVPKGSAVALPLLTAPYWLRDVVAVRGPTTAPAGAAFVLEPDAGLLVYADGTLAAEPSLSLIGSADEPITIGPRVPGQAPWGSVKFSTVDDANRMEHVHLDGGGAPDVFGSTGMVALDANGAGSLEIRDCVLEGSAGWGVAVDGQTVNADVETANTFADNAEGDVRW